MRTSNPKEKLLASKPGATRKCEFSWRTIILKDLRFSRHWLWRLPSSGMLTSCSSCKNQRFRLAYRLHHHGEKNQRARNNEEFRRLGCYVVWLL
jgi:hypothetical protein